MPAISIGDPALVAGGDVLLFYGGVVAGAIASVLFWWHFNRKAKQNFTGPRS